MAVVFLGQLGDDSPRHDSWNFSVIIPQPYRGLSLRKYSPLPLLFLIPGIRFWTMGTGYIYISFSKIGGAVSVPFLLQAAFHVINCTSCGLVVFHPSALSQARLLKSSRWLLPLSFQPPVCSSSWVLGSQLVANSLQQGNASGYADLYICQSDYDPTICSLLREYSRP